MKSVKTKIYNDIRQKASIMVYEKIPAYTWNLIYDNIEDIIENRISHQVTLQVLIEAEIPHFC